MNKFNGLFRSCWGGSRGPAALAAGGFFVAGLLPFFLEGGRGTLYAQEPWAPRRLALTFDDGPHPAFTGPLLEALQAGRAKATFFVVGGPSKRHPALLAAVARQGSELANHTLTHPNLVKIDLVDALRELDGARTLIKDAAGRPPRFFRPPGGRFSPRLLAAARAAGHDMALWTVLPRDHELPSADTVFQRVFAEADDGGVVLLHSGVPGTLDALPRLLRVLGLMGVRFVTLSELAAERPAAAEAWLNAPAPPKRPTELPPDAPLEGAAG